MCYFHKILRGNFFQQQISLIQYLTIVKIMLSQREKKIKRQIDISSEINRLSFIVFEIGYYYEAGPNGKNSNIIFHEI